MTMQGLRVVLFIAAVYSLVMGAINIHNLRGIIKETEDYFGKNG